MLTAVLGLLAFAPRPPKTRPELPYSAFAEEGAGSSSASSMASKSPKPKPDPSIGGSATLGTLSRLPGAIWTDTAGAASATAATTASAFAALHSLFSVTIPAATISALTLSGSAAFASYIAVTSYFKAITASGPNKPRPWLSRIPNPETFILGFATLHARNGIQCQFTALSVIGAAREIFTSMSTRPAYCDQVYETIDPNKNNQPYIRIFSFFSHNWDAVSLDTFGDFQSRVASEAEQTNLMIHKGMVKSAMKQLIKELGHLRHLLDKAVSAYTRPIGSGTWTQVCNITKPIRAAICPSNHSPVIRINKLAFQWLYCNILMSYHDVLLRSFISRLPEASPYAVAFYALNPMSRLAEPSSEESFEGESSSTQGSDLDSI